MIEGNLSGLLVVEVADLAAGPFCGRLFAGCGARVIKVEPLDGDVSRRTGPYWHDEPNPETSALHLYLNAGKEGVALDFGQAEGRTVLFDLLRQADVLVLGLTPPRMDALGLNPALLQQSFPQLVIGAVTVFGLSGPYRDFEATDLIASALSGTQFDSGEPEREPLRYYGYQPSYQAGIHAAMAIVAALLHREAAGVGSVVDATEFRSTMLMSEARIVEHALTGVNVPRTGRAVRVFPPPVYPCADGYVSMLTTDDQWPRFCAMAGLPELGADPRFQSAPGRANCFEELELAFLPWFLSQTRAELFELGQRHQVPIGPVNGPLEVLQDRHFQERGLLQLMEHPIAGTFQNLGLFYQSTATPVAALRPAPLLGQQTADVLSGLLGYDEARLTALRHQGVI